MPYCTNCGEEVTDEQRYCSYCGEPVGEEPTHDRGQRGAGGEDSYDRRTQDTTGPGGPTEQDTSGFEGDPPPKGYEDPPSIRETTQTGSPSPGAVDLFGQSFKRIFRLPVLLAGLILGWIGFLLVDFLPPALQFGGMVLAGLFGLLVAGMLYVVTEGHLNDKETTVPDAANQVLDQFLPLALIWLLYIPIFLVGLFLFILPGLYIGGRLLLAFPACVLDGEGAADSLSTSWELTSSNSLKPFGILGLAVLALFGLLLLIIIPMTGTLAAIGFDLAEIAAEDPQQATEAVEDLQNDFEFVLTAAFFQSIALAIPIGAVQIAAAHLYLVQRYGGVDS